MTIVMAAPLSEAWMLADQQCYAEALELAGEGLASDADDPGWHRLREHVLQRRDATSYRRHVADLERYAAEHADHRGLRVARLAAALWVDDKDCAQISAFVDGLTYGEAADRYEMLELSLEAADACDGERSEVQDAIRGVKKVPAAESLALTWTLQSYPDEVTPDELTRVLEADPRRAASTARALWGRKKGPAPLRKALLAQAEAWASSSEPRHLIAASAVLSRAGKAVPDGLDGALAAALPCAPVVDPATKPDGDWVDKVYDATRTPTHALALEGLEGLESRVPDRDADRRYWLEQRKRRHLGLDQSDEVYGLARQIARLAPDDGKAVAEFAALAGHRGEDVAEALSLLEAVRAARPEPVYDPSSGQAFDAFHRQAQATSARWDDARGWLLHHLGRDDEAVDVLNGAVMRHPSGPTHAHLGLVQQARQEPRLAFAHLREAFRHGLETPSLKEEARAALQELAVAHGAWHPAGTPAWIDALGDGEASPEAPDDDKPETHALIGKRFPYADAEGLGGEPVAIRGTGAAATVVDVWATWCGPCISGMPHLQEVAEAYEDRGVRVIGLSVDENKGAARRFYKGAEVDYELAWVGDGGFGELKIRGIPSLFVLDDKGVVVRKITGYGPGDRRVEAALDGLLGEEH